MASSEVYVAPRYPEHEKLLALRCPGKPEEPYASHNHLVGDFIEWLRGSADSGGGYALARWRYWCTVCESFWPDADKFCPACAASLRKRTQNPRLFEEHVTTETLLARFFGIDQEKLDDEKRAMLVAQREANVAAAKEAGR